MKRFQGLTNHITERLAVLSKDPVQRKAVQAPIRESVRDQLIRNQKKTDAYKEQRRSEKDHPLKKKQQNQER